jgi:hypothetical protein
MNWNELEGKRVNGLYLGLFPFRGTVVESRVKYGGKVQHTIELAEPITVYGATRERILVEAGDGSINRILDERDAEYARSINDNWYDEQYEGE